MKTVARRNGADSAKKQGHSTVEIPKTTHPHLASIGQSLGRSLQRHVVENDAVQSAFAELAFELELARQMGGPVTVAELLEPTG